MPSDDGSIVYFYNPQTRQIYLFDIAPAKIEPFSKIDSAVSSGRYLR